MKKQLTNLEKNIVKIVKGIVISLSIPVVVGIAKGDSKTVGAIIEEEKAKPFAVFKVQEFDTASLPEYCSQQYQRLTIETYNLCVYEGMSHYQVASVIGVNGEPRASSGSVEVFGWNGISTDGYGIQKGYMSVTFSNGKVISKAQYGLPSDTNLY